MTRRVLILGGGTGGTLTANRLRRAFSRAELEVVVVDRDDDHLYRPGLVHVPFALAAPERLTRSRRAQLSEGIELRLTPIDLVERSADAVRLADDSALGYDALVVATGSPARPEATAGLTGPGWGERVHACYDVDRAEALAAALEGFDGGRIVVAALGSPLAAPSVPLELSFLADWYFTERGVRERVDLRLVTPLAGAFPTAGAAEALERLLVAKRIGLVPGFSATAVEGSNGRIVAADGRTLEFDLAVVVPRQGGASFVGRSADLGDAEGFVRVDRRTLQAKGDPKVFAIGDAAAVPVMKDPIVTHLEGAVVARNVGRQLAAAPLDAAFDGHASCLLETGFNKAVLLDGGYDEPAEVGRTTGGIGPTLLKETRLNYLGKVMAEWIYWHSVLPGRDLPGVSPAATTRAQRHPIAS